MKTPMLKAVGLGFGVLLFAHVVWAIVLQSEAFPVTLAWTVQSAPVIAALVASYVAPRKKILIGLSMALVGALLSSLSNLAYSAFGLPVDFPGMRGSWVIFEIAVATNLVLCTAGSVAGYLLSTWRDKDRSSVVDS